MSSTLFDTQKYEFCLFAANDKLTRKEYVAWVEQKWGEIISTKITNPEAKRHKSVIVSEL
ncbi:1883_t:CDS:2, partial [Entrophospora sp. SA101]